MNIETFFEARDLYDKYQLCEKVMEYLSDEESVKGQKYLETLKQFVETFKMEFMTFVHERMEAVGMQFEDLHCPEHSEQPEVPTPPTEPKEPKFPIGSKVEVVDGKYKGRIGTVKEFDDEDGTYYVASDFNDNGTLFSMWFDENYLKAYEEESEETEDTPSIGGFAINDRVEIVAGTSMGMAGTVVGLDAEDNLLYVLLDGDDDSALFTPSELRKIDPENTEENGGTVTPDAGE